MITIELNCSNYVHRSNVLCLVDFGEKFCSTLDKHINTCKFFWRRNITFIKKLFVPIWYYRDLTIRCFVNSVNYAGQVKWTETCPLRSIGFVFIKISTNMEWINSFSYPCGHSMEAGAALK